MARAWRRPDPLTATATLVLNIQSVTNAGVLSMSLLATIAVAAEEGHHVVNELPFPAPVFGVIAFVLFTALAVVTFSFRDVANRHSAKAEAYAREHGADQH